MSVTIGRQREVSSTIHLLRKLVDFRISLVDDLIDLSIKIIIFFSQRLGQVLLVDAVAAVNQDDWRPWYDLYISWVAW